MESENLLNPSRIVFVFTKNHSHLVTHIWCGCRFSVLPQALTSFFPPTPGCLMWKPAPPQQLKEKEETSTLILPPVFFAHLLPLFPLWFCGQHVKTFNLSNPSLHMFMGWMKWACSSLVRVARSLLILCTTWCWWQIWHHGESSVAHSKWTVAPARFDSSQSHGTLRKSPSKSLGYLPSSATQISQILPVASCSAINCYPGPFSRKDHSGDIVHPEAAHFHWALGVELLCLVLPLTQHSKLDHGFTPNLRSFKMRDLERSI